MVKKNECGNSKYTHIGSASVYHDIHPWSHGNHGTVGKAKSNTHVPCTWTDGRRLIDQNCQMLAFLFTFQLPCLPGRSQSDVCCFHPEPHSNNDSDEFFLFYLSSLHKAVKCSVVYKVGTQDHGAGFEWPGSVISASHLSSSTNVLTYYLGEYKVHKLFQVWNFMDLLQSCFFFLFSKPKSLSSLVIP